MPTLEELYTARNALRAEIQTEQQQVKVLEDQIADMENAPPAFKSCPWCAQVPIVASKAYVDSIAAGPVARWFLQCQHEWVSSFFVVGGSQRRARFKLAEQWNARATP